MKATEQYFPVVLFIMLYKVVLTTESVDKILKCYHSNDTHVQYCRTDTDRYLQLTVRKFRTDRDLRLTVRMLRTDRHSCLRTVICG